MCEMAPLIGKESTKAKIMPVITELLKDENSDVRLNCVQNILKIADVLGNDFVDPPIIALLQNLIKDPQWRVRMAAVELIGRLSVKLGRESYRNSFETIYMGYLNNSAAAVRETGIIFSLELGKAFGQDWIVGSYLPKVIENYNTDKQPFNYRMTCLYSLCVVIPLLRDDAVTEFIVPTLIKACGDKVPNV